MISRLCLYIFLVFAMGCASVNSVSLTPIPADRSTAVSVEKSKIIILGLSFDNDFVNEIVESLKNQCPNGRVSGILTKDEDIHYFLFVMKKRVTATGYCQKTATVQNKQKPKRGTASEDEPFVEEAAL